MDISTFLMLEKVVKYYQNYSNKITFSLDHNYWPVTIWSVKLSIVENDICENLIVYSKFKIAALENIFRWNK